MFTRVERSNFLMFLLNEFRFSIILKCLGNFDQMRGPIYFIELLTNLTVSNLGSSKSLFRKFFWVFFKLNKSKIFRGTRLCLTLNIKMAMSWRPDCATSVVWRGLAVLDRTLIWFCTPPLALTPEPALAFSDPKHCKSARLDDSRLGPVYMKVGDLR